MHDDRSAARVGQLLRDVCLTCTFEASALARLACDVERGYGRKAAGVGHSCALGSGVRGACRPNCGPCTRACLCSYAGQDDQGIKEATTIMSGPDSPRVHNEGEHVRVYVWLVVQEHGWERTMLVYAKIRRAALGWCTCGVAGLVGLVVDHVLGRGGELGVRLDDLVDRLQEVLLGRCLSSGADGEHAGLSAHAADVGTGRVGAQARQEVEADVPLAVHRAAVDLEDVLAALEVWEAEFDLPVQTAGP
mmetsp:Transcript_206/g.420  ORF Transcript_206/g.420 Transcript_206/m.420 type:complete len:248 (+) Transcript_206:630-1373(+)